MSTTNIRTGAPAVAATEGDHADPAGGREVVGHAVVRHTVHDDIDGLLSPDGLSDLLGRRVTRVERSQAAVWGNAGSRFTRVATDAGDLVLKTMSMATDWEMYASDDVACRSVTTWQYGLLDRARPHLDAAVLACARDADTWAILMPDLPGGVLDDQDVDLGGGWSTSGSRTVLASFLDGLAGMHATFWDDPVLTDPRLGLDDPRTLLQLASPSFARRHLGQWDTWLVEAAVDGWDALTRALDDDAAGHARALIDDPTPLLDALARHPSTFLHGDVYPKNLAVDGGRRVAIDWQLALRSVATVDVARLVADVGLDERGRAMAVRHYRDSLESELGWRIEDDQWQEMVDLGFLVDALWISPFLAWLATAEDDPGLVAYCEGRIRDANEHVRRGVRRL